MVKWKTLLSYTVRRLRMCSLTHTRVRKSHFCFDYSVVMCLLWVPQFYGTAIITTLILEWRTVLSCQGHLSTGKERDEWWEGVYDVHQMLILPPEILPNINISYNLIMLIFFKSTKLQAIMKKAFTEWINLGIKQPLTKLLKDLIV